ncbi:MAG: GNAT family N-acetyltransferase [Smithella sp.]
MNTTAEYDIRVIKSLEEIEDIRNFWETHQYYPDADIDFYIAFCRANKENVSPHITVLMKKGRPDAIMIGRVDHTDFNFRFGYKVLFSTKVHSLNILYGGIIGNHSDLAHDLLFESVMDSLSKGKADVAFFNHVIVDSHIYNLVLNHPHYFFRDHSPKVNQHWMATLSDSFDEFYRTRPKNFKNNFKKNSKRLNDRYGNNKIVKIFQDISDYKILLDDIEIIASKTYHRGMSVGFLNDQTTKERILLALEQERFRAYIIYLNSLPCAFLTGVKYGNTFFPWATGYDPAFHQYSLGTLIIMEMFNAQYKEGDIQAVDFGFGDAFYKHNFCNHNWQEKPIYIYAPTLKGLLLNITKSLLDIISNFTEHALKKFNLIDKIKKLWRAKLAQNKKDNNKNPG